MRFETSRRTFLKTGAAAASLSLSDLNRLFAAEGVPQSVQELWADFDPRKDPLEIDAIYTNLGVAGTSLAGSRTDGSAHMLMRAASGIEMALWDLAGRALGVPVTTLLGGKFRDREIGRAHV